MTKRSKALILSAGLALFALPSGAWAHGGHLSCELGPYGWHRHPGGARVACVPHAPHPFRCWVGRFGHRHCWW